jgi:L-alanine-DL-glutamate epimerase-like enolase superfamily enzyme
MTFQVAIEKFPIAGDGFIISREMKRDAIVVHVTIEKRDMRGEGECVPLKRYGHTPEQIKQEIETYLDEYQLDRHALNEILPPGPARFALDTALWELEAAESGRSFQNYFYAMHPEWRKDDEGVPTAFTISGAAPEKMAMQAAQYTQYRWLKIKLMGDGQDAQRIELIHQAVPKMDIIVDANESLTLESLPALLPVCEKNNVVLIEQPLPEGKDDGLHNFHSSIPFAADESCHTLDDLENLRDKYGVVNIKLDKSGGLTHATHMIKAAQEMGFKTMIGCMASTSLSIYPARLLASAADFVDLDGALLLQKDRDGMKIAYREGKIYLLG